MSVLSWLLDVTQIYYTLFFKSRLFLFSVYEVYLYACMYVSNMYAKYLWRLEVGIGSAGMGVSDACEPT